MRRCNRLNVLWIVPLIAGCLGPEEASEEAPTQDGPVVVVVPAVVEVPADEAPADVEPPAAEDTPEVDRPAADTPADDTPEVDPPVDVVPPVGFVVDLLAEDARSPVVATLPSGVVRHGWIDGLTGGARIGGPGLEAVVELPDVVGATAITMAPDLEQDDLHVVVDPGGALRYFRVAGDGAVLATHEVGGPPARDPTLAVSPLGEVVVAWTADSDDPQVAASIQVARGTIAGTWNGFGPPESASAGCCVNPDFGEPADQVSGASIAIGEDGVVHLVYEWTTWANTTIDYVNDADGSFGLRHVIADVAYAPCPALMVDEAGVHVTYLTEGNHDVWYRLIQGADITAPISLFHAEHFITMAMTTLHDGILHVGFTSLGGTHTKLTYVQATPAGHADPIIVTEAPNPSFLELTPNAGGAALDVEAGIARYAYTRLPEWAPGVTAGQAEVASGP